MCFQVAVTLKTHLFYYSATATIGGEYNPNPVFYGRIFANTSLKYS